MWQPRAADPELETEFLRRLMVKLGVSQEQSQALAAAGVAKSVSRVTMVNGQPTVQIDDGFDRAWRRVGLSLDRTNFTVEDRDRSKGLYFVRYVAPAADKAEPGFLGKLLSFGSSTPDSKPQKFRVSVVSQGDKTAVSVQNADGSVAAATDAQRIASVLAEDLK
jgi:outer membrane protein assembly factor BamC